MPSGNAVCDDSFGDTSSDCTLDDSGDGVHGPDYLGLELRRHVKLDLLEKVLGRAKATNNEDVLEKLANHSSTIDGHYLPAEICSVPEWQ